MKTVKTLEEERKTHHTQTATHRITIVQTDFSLGQTEQNFQFAIRKINELTSQKKNERTSPHLLQTSLLV